MNKKNLRFRMSKTYLHDLIEEEVYKEAHGIKNPLKRYFVRYMLRNNKPSTRIVYLFRKMQYFYSKDNVLYHYYALHLYKKIWNESSCLISPLSEIGKGIKFPHPTGIVIGGASTIGQNVCIHQNVCIGSCRKGDYEKGFQPTIGNNVICFSSSQILGNITIGSDSIIAAGAVVLNDITSKSVAVGVPAHITKKTNKYEY